MSITNKLNELADSITDTARDTFDKALGDDGFSLFSSITDHASEYFKDIIGGTAGFLTDLVNSLGGTLTVDALADEIVAPTRKAAFDSVDPADSEGRTFRQQYVEAMNENEKTVAADIVSPFSEIPREELQSIFELTTATSAGQIIVDQSTLALPPAFQIGSTFGTLNPEFFSYIATVEELEAEMQTIVRPLTEVIVHWTETYTNANMDADQIRDMAVALGADKMPYHYVIKRDGSLQRGLPVSEEADHCPKNGHNQYSISLCFVGGLNISTGASDADEFTQSSSLTREQFNTFYEFLKAFYNKYPGGQVLGHRDIEEGQEDPGFDVIDYCEAEFGKVTIYNDTFNDQALSPGDINRYTRDLDKESRSRFIFGGFRE